MNKERNIYFDILRGFFIFLALWQHYAYFLNVYFIDYFRESEIVSLFYKNFYEQVQLTQNYLPTDALSVWASNTFTPFVSQVFLTLACFNLAKHHEEFKKVFASKIKLFLAIFVFFYFENILVATSAGDALSLNPINTWMIVLICISALYYVFDYKFLFFAIPISLFLVGDYDFGMESYFRDIFHPDFTIDASPHYFFPSAFVGFALGLINLKNRHWFKLLLPAFVLIFLVGKIFGPEYSTANFDVFLNEHLKAVTILGTFEIIGTQGILICLSWVLPQKNILKTFQYVGRESIFIFAMHRVFFLKLWMPLYIHGVLLLGFNLTNNFVLIWTSIVLNVLFCLSLKKSGIIKKIMGDK